MKVAGILLALGACRAPSATIVHLQARDASSGEIPAVVMAPETPGRRDSSDAAISGPAAPPSSPFHDAVIGYPDPDDAQLPNALAVCPFRGRTFICGVSDAPLLSTDDGVVTDEALEAKVTSGASVPVPWRALAAGTWSDSAWLVGGLRQSSFAYRHTKDGWSRFATWTSQPAHEAIAWGDGVLITPFEAPSESGGWPVYNLALVHAGDGRVTPVSTKLVSRAPAPDPYHLPIVRGIARADNVLFVVAEREGMLAVERKGEGVDIVEEIATMDNQDDGEIEHVTAHLWTASPSLAVVFGSVNRRALLQRFDGRAWTPIAVPGAIKGVAAYDQTTDGKERLFGSDFALYERFLDSPMSAESWHAVPMPILHREDQIHAVWLANDDAWLLVWPDAIPTRPSSTRPARLMRMKPVKHVWSPKDVFPH
jgi:hypothetical protein